MRPDHETKTIRVGKHRIYTRRFVTQKDAPTVILIHGLGVSGRYMIPLAKELARRGVNAYIIDLPGFGKSSKPAAVLNIHELADVIPAWMKKVNISQAVFAGNSFGCQVIVDLVVRHPEYAQGTILIGPTIDPNERSAFRQCVRVTTDMIKEPLSLILILLFDYRQCGPRRAMRTFQYALRDKVEEKLPFVKAPTLIIRHSDDPLVSDRWIERMRTLLPDGYIRTLVGSGHSVHYTDPIPIADMIRHFILNHIHNHNNEKKTE